MFKKKIEIPFEGNDQYYEGIRSLLVSSICSVLGIILYSALLGKITRENFSLDAMVALLYWVSICFVLWIISFKKTYRIFVFFIEPTPRPKVAGFFLILLNIVIGTFCALFYDTFTMLDNPLSTVDNFRKTFKAFLITAGCMTVLLLAFRKYAVSKVTTLKASV